MKRAEVIGSRAYGPETLSALHQAFDEAWAAIANNIGSDVRDVKDARNRLADALLAAAEQDCRDVGKLKTTALRIMALRYERTRRF